MKTLYAPEKVNALEVLFPNKKPITAVIHLPPLPGSPNYRGESMQKIIDFALNDLEILQSEGVDGAWVENAGDVPFLKGDDIGHETTAGMAAVTQEVVKAAKIPIGIAVMCNAVIPALAVAKATGAKFIRPSQWVLSYIDWAGFMDGPAGKALRYRSFIKADDVKIFTDVHFQHGAHAIVADRPVEDQVRDAEFFGADVVIATGQRGAQPTPLKELLTVRDAVNLPVFVGSGLNPNNVMECLAPADGAVVGCTFRKGNVWWGKMERDNVARFMDVVRKLRASQ